MQSATRHSENHERASGTGEGEWGANERVGGFINTLSLIIKKLP